MRVSVLPFSMQRNHALSIGLQTTFVPYCSKDAVCCSYDFGGSLSYRNVNSALMLGDWLSNYHEVPTINSV